MLKIEVLGTGCRKCRKLFEEAEAAVGQSGLPALVEKVESLDDIMAYGVMMTPALVINGEVKSSGKLPGVATIVSWLNAATEG